MPRSLRPVQPVHRHPHRQALSPPARACPRRRRLLRRHCRPPVARAQHLRPLAPPARPPHSPRPKSSRSPFWSRQRNPLRNNRLPRRCRRRRLPGYPFLHNRLRRRPLLRMLRPSARCRRRLAPRPQPAPHLWSHRRHLAPHRAHRCRSARPPLPHRPHRSHQLRLHHPLPQSRVPLPPAPAPASAPRRPFRFRPPAPTARPSPPACAAPATT